MTSLTKIAAIDEGTAARLKGISIGSVQKLLEVGASASGRRTIAATAGFEGERILGWVRHADLMRIKGVGGHYAELLEAAAVDSVPELAQRTATGLRQAMEEANSAERGLVQLLPSVFTVRRWVAEAQTVPPLVGY